MQRRSFFGRLMVAALAFLTGRAQAEPELTEAEAREWLIRQGAILSDASPGFPAEALWANCCPPRWFLQIFGDSHRTIARIYREWEGADHVWRQHHLPRRTPCSGTCPMCKHGTPQLQEIRLAEPDAWVKLIVTP